MSSNLTPSANHRVYNHRLSNYSNAPLTKASCLRLHLRMDTMRTRRTRWPLMIGGTLVALSFSCIDAKPKLLNSPEQTVLASLENANKRPMFVQQFQPGKVRLAATLSECQRALRDAVGLCDSIFNSTGSAYYRNTQWHNTCLSNARTNFDNCRSTIGQ